MTEMPDRTAAAHVLALDTSTPRTALALLVRDGRVLRRSLEGSLEARHGRILIPEIQALLREGGVATRELEAIAVGLGPGSFTGLRIGLVAVKTLALAAGADVLPLDSMALIAANAGSTVEHVAVIVDAQRGGVCVTEFTRGTNGSLQREGATRIAGPEELARTLPADTCVLGPAAARVRLLRDDLGAADSTLDLPGDDALAQAARRAWCSGPRGDIWTLEPCYVRAAAAEEKAAAQASDARGGSSQ